MGSVTHWLYSNGAEPRLGSDEYWTLSEIYVKSHDARACVARTWDGAVFVFDMRWETIGNWVPTEIDHAPVNWYSSIDEAIVRTMMSFAT